MVGAHVATVIFIRAHVSSCTAPLSVPTQHKRTHQLGLVALASISSSSISFLLQQLFFSVGWGGGSSPSSFSMYCDSPLFLKIEKALWCWLRYYSALDQLNLSFWTPSANFCHSRRQMCNLSPRSTPLPRAHWLSETAFLSPLKCCV